MLRSPKNVRAVLLTLASVAPAAFGQASPSSAVSHPFTDTQHLQGIQSIPGRVHMALYDLGGEGVAYHDSDPANHGSGELNPANGTYLNEFRMREGVDISYTKFNRAPNAIDDSPFDKVKPEADQLYVGWTEVGEWFKVTVDVRKPGLYAADLLYTSNRGGAISIDVDGRDVTGPVEIASTFDAQDPVAWRQWHHWNLAHNVVRLPLAKGKSVLTVHIVKGGNLNLAYLDFKEAH